LKVFICTLILKTTLPKLFFGNKKLSNLADAAWCNNT
jgi:hypothetical protein